MVSLPEVFLGAQFMGSFPAYSKFGCPMRSMHMRSSNIFICNLLDGSFRFKHILEKSGVNDLTADVS